MAQPAVSRIVVELEDRLGVKLLERTTRRVRLTEPGRYLLEEAQAILDRIDVAENTVKLLAHRHLGEFSGSATRPSPAIS
jgi:DNA-binding transcriptional LysR family regulator